MGGYSANSSNVNFAYALALQTARDLYALAGVVNTKHDARATEAGLATDAWVGGHRDTFDTKMTTEGTDADTVRGGLIALADTFATEWAAAWGEQDRINHARYAQHEKDNDSWAEDVGEFFVGEDDYGPPPEDPAAPEGPDYGITRSPIHPEFEGDSSRTSPAGASAAA